MTRSQETTGVHTRLLRLNLATSECAAYWAHVLEAPPKERAGLAFDRRWFGPKSMARVRLLLANMAARFDAFPDALAVLARWQPRDEATRRIICHLHLQLADPLYRRFSGDYLARRRALGRTALDREQVVAWLNEETGHRWATSTAVRFASALLTSALEAGLLEERKDPRKLVQPQVPDAALSYAMYLLRGLEYAGSLQDNPYLASLGISGNEFDYRMSRLSSLSYRRLGDVVDIEWAEPDLRSWASHRQEAVAP